MKTHSSVKRRFKVKFFSVSLTLLVLFIFTCLYFINIAPESNITKQNTLQQLAPQGFAFYSKNPREEAFYFESEEKLAVPNFSRGNLYGLNRNGRTQGIELGKIFTSITEDYWKTCNTKEECDKEKDQLKDFKVKKDRNYRSLDSGIYYIYRYEPLSWYFRDFEDSSDLDKKVAKVILYE